MSVTTTPTIVFGEIPASPALQYPGDYIEIKAGYDNAGVLPFPARNLLVGQMTGAGTGTALTVYQNVTDPLTVRALGGSGSMIDRIATKHLAANKNIPTDVIMVADAGGSTKAAWTRAFAIAAASSYQYAENICGERVTFGVQTGDAASVQAANYAAAINAFGTLPIVATVGTGGAANVVTMTARNGGAAANDHSFVVNPLPGDVVPAGASTLTQTVVGATNPSIAPVIAIMARWYTDAVLPWNDTANLLAASAEAERRFNAMVMRDLRWHYGYNGSLSQSLANALGANARFLVQAPFYGPGSEPYSIASSLMGVVSNALLDDPSAQMKGLALPGVVGPVYANAWQDEPDGNALLAGGCSVFHVSHTGAISILRIVTTYTQNAAGALDYGWHDIMEIAVASRVRYDWRTYRDQIWGGAKLANDNDAAAQLNNGICTPRRNIGSWAARCRLYASLGWIIDVDAQVKRSKCWIDTSDKNRLNEQLYYTRIGNVNIIAGQLIFNV